jgi:hypothetical protein
MIAGASPANDNAAVARLSVSAATALACIDRTALPSGDLSKAEVVELRGLEPLTSFMPSTIDPSGGPDLRLAMVHPRQPRTATMRAAW